MVREKGVEPLRPKALEPKSSASASSATLAHIAYFTKSAKIRQVYLISPLFASPLTCLVSSPLLTALLHYQ
jgi:hypothetical protein